MLGAAPASGLYGRQFVRAEKVGRRPLEARAEDGVVAPEEERDQRADLGFRAQRVVHIDPVRGHALRGQRGIQLRADPPRRRPRSRR
ncbi:MAG: hypothetical protein R2851_25290 [Caldilineaceae bacterium]